MKRFPTTVVTLMLLATVPGCGHLSSAESLTRQLIKLLNDTADTLATIHDEGSARAAADKLQRLSQKRNDLQGQLIRARQDGISVEDSRRLEEAYGDQLKAAMQRVAQETVRLHSVPGAWQVISSHMRPMAPGAGPRGPGGYAARESQLIAMYGPRKTLTLLVEDTPGDVGAAIAKKIQAICKPSQASYQSQGHVFRMVCAPVDDIPGVAAKIDFGTVVETDFDKGYIRVKADASRLPKPLAAAVTDPQDPRFYTQNLEDMRSVDEFRARTAAERLAKEKPGGPQQEIVAAAEKLVRENRLACRPAIGVVVNYRGADSIPLLVEVVSDPKFGFSREEAAKFLIQYDDPRVWEAMAGLVLNDTMLARKFWRKIGASGQHALFPYLQHADTKARREAIEILGEIGSAESIPALIEVLDDDDREIQKLAVRTLGSLRDRRAISPLCKLLLTERVRTEAVRALSGMGPMVEDIVIKGLKHSDPAVVKACCNVLQEVGTKKSLVALEELLHSTEREKQRDAEWTKMIIERRIPH